ncbi:MAG: glycosyltransferase family 4 protein [Candidatus Promineofilum sp.]|nr:glycosyltransferase family 4 protein [Promineifilum sp.]
MTVSVPFSAPRVLIAGVKWPPETFLARLIRGLAARNIRVSVMVATRPTGEWRQLPNVDFLMAPGWDGSVVGRLARAGSQLAAASWRSWPETRRAVHLERERESAISLSERFSRMLPFIGREWDVIYFPWNATAVFYDSLMDKAPSVISCRGAQINVGPHNPRRTWLREGLEPTFHKAAAVHCVSAAIRDEAVQYGLTPDKAVIIRPAVDPDVFRPADAKDEDAGLFRLITTGSIIWRKGYEYALSAIRQLVDRGVPVRFDIIGNGPEYQRLLYTIRDLELDEYVFLHGRLAPAGVVARLQAADVFLLSSLSEGISNAVLEGMACGLPVVTTAVGGMAEAVDDGVEGFVVPSRDPAAMAEALSALWLDTELRHRMGAAGRVRVQRDFRLSEQADAFVELFRRVA